ncbi:hypothetical protein BJY16_002478 [Actinoplanes octamycinicus]|uniref:Uncharacterized protein n=1 Tax=Actinoplanes octamycinicus TaxID=135948 RepID=A0A7W7GVD9_9ACTN|nr:hypothetical protein [Actinoplanes octamycinicus]
MIVMSPIAPAVRFAVGDEWRWSAAVKPCCVHRD